MVNPAVKVHPRASRALWVSTTRTAAWEHPMRGSGVESTCAVGLAAAGVVAAAGATTGWAAASSAVTASATTSASRPGRPIHSSWPIRACGIQLTTREGTTATTNRDDWPSA